MQRSLQSHKKRYFFHISLPEGSGGRLAPWHYPNWEETLQQNISNFCNHIFFYKIVSPDGTRELLISSQASHRPFGEPHAVRSVPSIRSGGWDILWVIWWGVLSSLSSMAWGWQWWWVTNMKQRTKFRAQESTMPFMFETIVDQLWLTHFGAENRQIWSCIYP